MPLYAGVVPGSKPSSVKEQVIFVNGTVRISSVITPTLTRFTPAKPNGVSVIICPGGGYSRLAMDHEGIEVAKALNEFGITTFVLKYRLPNDTIMVDKTTGPLQDAQQICKKTSSSLGIESK
jgi:acetyl esterase/lipase